MSAEPNELLFEIDDLIKKDVTNLPREATSKTGSKSHSFFKPEETEATPIPTTGTSSPTDSPLMRIGIPINGGKPEDVASSVGNAHAYFHNKPTGVQLYGTKPQGSTSCPVKASLKYV